MDLTTFTAVGLLALAVYQGQNLIRYLRAADWNGTLGITLAWALGIAVAHIAAASNATDSLVLIDGAPPLGLLNGASLALLGIGIGSLGSGIADTRNAVDNSTSAVKPKLIENTTPDHD